MFKKLAITAALAGALGLAGLGTSPAGADEFWYNPGVSVNAGNYAFVNVAPVIAGIDTFRSGGLVYFDVRTNHSFHFEATASNFFRQERALDYSAIDKWDSIPSNVNWWTLQDLHPEAGGAGPEYTGWVWIGSGQAATVGTHNGGVRLGFRVLPSGPVELSADAGWYYAWLNLNVTLLPALFMTDTHTVWPS